MNTKFHNVAGLIRQPKWGHLRDLHKVIKLIEDTLLATDPTITSLGTNLEVYPLHIDLCLASLYNYGYVYEL